MTMEDNNILKDNDDKNCKQTVNVDVHTAETVSCVEKESYSAPNEEKSIPCPFCDSLFMNLSELKRHIQITHIETNSTESIPTDDCDVQGDVVGNPEEIEKHMIFEHSRENIGCTKCDKTFPNIDEINNHMQAEHKEPFPCQICGLVLATFSMLEEHINNFHTPKSEACKYCDQTFGTENEVKEHTIKEHEDVMMVQTMFLQINDLTEKFETHDSFKTEVLSMLKVLCENQTEMKKEMISLKNIIAENKPELAGTKNDEMKASAKPEPPNVDKKLSAQTHISPKHSRVAVKSKFNQKSKVLYVADSVGHTVSANKIEKANNCRVVTAKAYSSVNDIQARLPKQNFKDVVQNTLANPGRDDIDILIMSAPTVDISNLDTSRLTPEQDTTFFQEKAKESSKNMFKLAEKSLVENQNLEKVILMDHPPRFDLINQDPLSLKPKLAKLANSTLGELWLNSEHKHKIFIGQHSLESTGMSSSHFDRYKDQNTGRYDGVHLYGRRGCPDYTNSVNTIMFLAMEGPSSSRNIENGRAQQEDHTNCPQAKYQRRQVFEKLYQPNISTSNRFSVFNSNMGNY